MKKQVFTENKHEFRDYIFDDITVRYIISERGRVYMNILPAGIAENTVYNFDGSRVGRIFEGEGNYVQEDNGEFPDARMYLPGALVHLYIRGDKRCSLSDSYKFSSSIDNLRFAKQNTETDGNFVTVTTVLKEERYTLEHILVKDERTKGVKVNTRFINTSDTVLTLEAITSATLDNLSPFRTDDSSEDVFLHSFRGSWSAEGRHIEESVAALNLNKAWGDSCENVKKGSTGSRACFGHYPYIALEDRENSVIWGMKLYHNSTWQGELTRYSCHLSMSMGIGDLSFGAWFKNIKPGETFETPRTAVMAVRGGIAELSNAMIEMDEERIRSFGEEGLPVVFNAYCSVKRPNSKNMLKYLDLMSRINFKYFVMDAGWYENEYGPGIGDWEVNKTAFPDGMKSYAEKVKNKGFVPGIWFEFECCNEGGEHYDERYADMHLKKDGYPLVCRVNAGRYKKFFDFTKSEVIEYLTEKVIELLKDSGFGYLKIDYNTDIGIGCDGAESYGEGLRIQMNAVLSFIRRIKDNVPGIIIESCASGGGRADALTLEYAQMCSFSDAHESVEFPIIAANQHYILPPAQSQIWCTLRPFFSENHFAYSISAGFLGRLCWSGNLDELDDKQFALVQKATDFYYGIAEIIKYGDSFIYRTGQFNYRRPKGSQMVVRYTHDRKKALIVYHRFYESKDMRIELEGKYKVVKKLFEDGSFIENYVYNICDGGDIFGNVVLLEKYTDSDIDSTIFS